MPLNHESKTVVLLGKGSLAVRIGQWFCENPGYSLKLVVPVMPVPTWTESLGDYWAKEGTLQS